jgi:hypothetical protein
MTPTKSKTRFRFWLWLIAMIGVIVPRRLRADWRQEWEAELRYRERLLAEWEGLDGNAMHRQDSQAHIFSKRLFNKRAWGVYQ